MPEVDTTAMILPWVLAAFLGGIVVGGLAMWVIDARAAPMALASLPQNIAVTRDAEGRIVGLGVGQ